MSVDSIVDCQILRVRDFRGERSPCAILSSNQCTCNTYLIFSIDRVRTTSITDLTRDPPTRISHAVFLPTRHTYPNRGEPWVKIFTEFAERHGLRENEQHLRPSPLLTCGQVDMVAICIRPPRQIAKFYRDSSSDDRSSRQRSSKCLTGREEKVSRKIESRWT